MSYVEVVAGLYARDRLHRHTRQLHFIFNAFLIHKIFALPHSRKGWKTARKIKRSTSPGKNVTEYIRQHFCLICYKTLRFAKKTSLFHPSWYARALHIVFHDWYYQLTPLSAKYFWLATYICLANAYNLTSLDCARTLVVIVSQLIRSLGLGECHEATLCILILCVSKSKTQTTKCNAR